MKKLFYIMAAIIIMSCSTEKKEKVIDTTQPPEWSKDQVWYRCAKQERQGEDDYCRPPEVMRHVEGRDRARRGSGQHRDDGQRAMKPPG